MSSESYSVVHSSAMDFLRQLRAESIDCIITDPPYESLEKHRKVGTTTRLKHSKSSSNDWFEVIPNAAFPELFAEFYRVLKQDRHFYLFCDQETMFAAKPAAEAAGFRFWKPIVWDKVAIGMGYHYRCRYEFILFFEKGKRALNNLSVPDLLEVPEGPTGDEDADLDAFLPDRASGPDIIREKRIRNGYPTEKPTEVIDVLVTQSTDPGEIVLDPFMGSGATGVAALHNGRLFLGCDLKAEAVTWAEGRLRSAA